MAVFIKEKNDYLFALDNGADLLSLSLPAGNYLVTTTVSAFNTDPDPQRLGRTLNPMGRSEEVALAEDGQPNHAQLTVIAPLSTGAPAVVTVHCRGFQILPERVVMTALPVSTINVQ